METSQTHPRGWNLAPLRMYGWASPNLAAPSGPVGPLTGGDACYVTPPFLVSFHLW